MINDDIWMEGSEPEGLIYSVHKKKVNTSLKIITYYYTRFKIYAVILMKRLNEELDMKVLLPYSEEGFREGRVRVPWTRCTLKKKKRRIVFDSVGRVNKLFI